MPPAPVQTAMIAAHDIAYHDYEGIATDLDERERLVADLGGVGLHDDGVPIDEFANAVMARLAKGEIEVGYGLSDHFRTATRDELATLYRQLNGLHD